MQIKCTLCEFKLASGPLLSVTGGRDGCHRKDSLTQEPWLLLACSPVLRSTWTPCLMRIELAKSTMKTHCHGSQPDPSISASGSRLQKGPDAGGAARVPEKDA